MENLLSPWFLREDKIVTAMKPGTRLQMIAVDDIGRFAAAAFIDAEKWNGAAVDLAGDAVTMLEAARTLSEIVGKEVTFQEIPIVAVRENSEDFALVLEGFESTGYSADIPGLESSVGSCSQEFCRMGERTENLIGAPVELDRERLKVCRALPVRRPREMGVLLDLLRSRRATRVVVTTRCLDAQFTLGDASADGAGLERALRMPDLGEGDDAYELAAVGHEDPTHAPSFHLLFDFVHFVVGTAEQRIAGHDGGDGLAVEVASLETPSRHDVAVGEQTNWGSSRIAHADEPDALVCHGLHRCANRIDG